MMTLSLTEEQALALRNLNNLGVQRLGQELAQGGMQALSQDVLTLMSQAMEIDAAVVAAAKKQEIPDAED